MAIFHMLNYQRVDVYRCVRFDAWTRPVKNRQIELISSCRGSTSPAFAVPHWKSWLVMVNKGNHPQMALIQVSELLQFTQVLDLLCVWISLELGRLQQGMSIS